MRKRKNEIIRLQSIIENDRINTGDSFGNLVVLDLNNLLKEYFDFKDMPTLNIEKSGSDLLVQISLSCSRIKNFINIEQ